MNKKNPISQRQMAKEIEMMRSIAPLKTLLNEYQLPRSSFYYHRKIMSSNKYGRAKLLIEYIYKESNGRYGYRRIKLVLERDYGLKLAYKTVRKLMKEKLIRCQIKNKHANSVYHVPKKVINILNRDFSCDEPDVKWVTDVTEFRLGKQHLYLSIIKDLFNMEIVAYQLSRNNDWKLILDTLEKCSNVENLKHVILHSDQGVIYQSNKYKSYLNEHNYIQSMSRKGKCLDNAPAESFFGTLKSETIYNQKIHNMDELIDTLVEYIDWYNNKRISTKLKGYSPREYRRIYSS